MLRYIIRRLLQAIPVFIGVTLITFILFFIAPGDPARLIAGQRADAETIARVRAMWGLDKPLPVQYLLFLGRIVRLDFGRSFKTNIPVIVSIGERLQATAVLAFFAFIIAVFLGVTAGIISAVRQYSLFDYTAMVVALLGVSAPVYWVGIILLLIFGFNLGWLPLGGYISEYGIKAVILPAITLGTRPAAYFARLSRSSMLEVIRQEYITTARAKGLPESKVIFKHALRNALIPVVTYAGMVVGDLLTGAVLTETIFAWPGIGRLVVQAILDRDLPVLQGGVIVIALIYILANLIVDLSYALIDPRIRYE
ncbi:MULTISPECIES: ABC transporter permease [Dictyoglomus]|uniref:Binding-protein-dependent transport systems inner membrane component n=1 Tax=Dictyoglomus turgidum (strain DSM 6724 / Z-1310) TaxID=515635 RepID=B8E2R5_DICTD|nr:MULTISPECIES: ABC transporter permease [Dictyoglomus]ACK42415.1 binding-protein-dependent transport systems inner membrane component [Dictyoglomus turgidum DSM 6724]PNV80710.1 MAG: ABC transporter permease [Dictyoglomus turgidum]HBU32129.1 ABC transporter permease [Dictyoglomus sp.]